MKDSLKEITAIEPAQSGPSLPCARRSRSTLNSRVFCSPQQRQIDCSHSRRTSFRFWKYRFEKASIRPAASLPRTIRKFRCDELPVAQAEPAPLRPAAAVVAQARANSRTSSNKPVGHRRCGRSAHNCRRARSRSSAPAWFAPTQATRSVEWQGRASSSASPGQTSAVRTLLNRIGPEKSNGSAQRAGQISIAWPVGDVRRLR